MNRRGSVVLMACIFILIGCGFLMRLYYSKPVMFLGKTWRGSYESRILGILDTYGKDASSAPRAVEAPILSLRPINGGSVRVIVLEGKFDKDSVDPADVWKKYLHDGNYVLVNSVDEKQSTTSAAISNSIGQGCGLQSYDKDIINLGDVTFHNCREGSKYANLFGKGKVANAAIVVWNPGNDGRPPCWQKANSDQYQDCITLAINTALNNFFSVKNSDELNKSVIMIPALGTGQGSVRKVVFYEALSRHLRNALSEQSPWNTTIVLQVYRVSNDWKDTKSAIASSFGLLAEFWEQHGPEGSGTDLSFLAGISFTIGTILLCYVFWPKLASVVVPSSIFSLGLGPLSVGWFATSAGLMAVMKQGVLLAGFPMPHWFAALGGCLAVFLCVPLMRWIANFEERSKGAT